MAVRIALQVICSDRDAEFIVNELHQCSCALDGDAPVLVERVGLIEGLSRDEKWLVDRAFEAYLKEREVV